MKRFRLIERFRIFFRFFEISLSLKRVERFEKKSSVYAEKIEIRDVPNLK